MLILRSFLRWARAAGIVSLLLSMVAGTAGVAQTPATPDPAQVSLRAVYLLARSQALLNAGKLEAAWDTVLVADSLYALLPDNSTERWRGAADVQLIAGIILANSGNSADALVAWADAIELYEAISSEPRYNLALALDYSSELERQLGRIDDALSHARRATEMFGRLGAAADVKIARAHAVSNLGAALGMADSTDAALRAFEAAFQLYDSAPKRIVGHSRVVVQILEALDRARRYRELIAWGDRTLRTLEEYGSADTLMTALTMLADAYHKAGDGPLAVANLQQALSVGERFRVSDPHLARAHDNLAIELGKLSRLAEAVRETRRAVSLSSIPEDARNHAMYLYHHAVLLRELKLYGAALDTIEVAIQGLEKLEGTQAARAEYLLELAVLTERAGDDEAATKEAAILRRGIAIADSARADLLQTKLRFNLAGIQYKQKTTRPEAIAYFQQVLARARGLLPELEELYGPAAIMVASDRHERGNFADAAALLDSAMTTLQQAGSHGGLPELRSNLGIALAAVGQPARAAELLVENIREDWETAALNLPAMSEHHKHVFSDSILGPPHLLYNLVFNNKDVDPSLGLEVALLSRGVASGAARKERQVLMGAVRARGVRFGELSDLRRRISHRVLRDSGGDGLAELLSDSLRNLEKDIYSDTALFRAAARLKSVNVSDIARVLRPEDVLVEYVLYQTVDFKGRTLTGHWRYGALSLHGGSGRVIAVDLGPREDIDGAIAAFRTEYATQAGALLDEDALVASATRVRELVFDSLTRNAGPFKRIYVSATGQVTLVPFEALPTTRLGPPWHYLVEDYEFIYVPSGRALTGEIESVRTTSRSGGVVVGDPDFNASFDDRVRGLTPAPVSFVPTSRARVLASRDPSAPSALMGKEIPAQSGTPLRKTWPQMDKTRVLVSAIGALADSAGQSVQLFVGAGASEEAVMQVESPRFLVLASHGYFMEVPPPGRAAHWEFRSGPEGTKSDISADFLESIDPLHRSMIVLAGANRRNDPISTRARASSQSRASGAAAPVSIESGDGLLTAYEVMGLDLEGTDLVVLVGCETGLGVMQSEGAAGRRSLWQQGRGETLAGLRQAFWIAGAKALVMSLWPMGDVPAVRQMLGFFERWLPTKSPSFGAFRAAQLQALREARSSGSSHPFWWGGFIYYGDPGDLSSPSHN